MAAFSVEGLLNPFLLTQKLRVCDNETMKEAAQDRRYEFNGRRYNVPQFLFQEETSDIQITQFMHIYL